MEQEPSLGYLMSCKSAYLSGVYPFNPDFTSNDFYRQLQDMSSQIELKDFIGYLMEYQYYVNLWTSYFILEYFKPTIEQKLIGMNDEQSVVTDCIETIERYADGFEDTNQSDNCRIWLKKVKNYYAIA